MCPNTTPGIPNTRHFWYLTLEGIEDCKAKGLCYNCDEKFSRNQLCSGLFGWSWTFQKVVVAMGLTQRKMSPKFPYTP